MITREEIKKAAYESSRGYSTENYDSFIEGVEWVLNHPKEAESKEFDLFKEAISAKSEDRLFFKPTGSKLIIGSPSIDQVQAELLGTIIIKKDYSIIFADFNGSIRANENGEIINCAQIGLVKK